MKKQAEEKGNKQLERRLSHAGSNPVLKAALTIADEEKRWNALRAAGYCGYAAGSCKQGPHGTVAKCEVNPSTKEPFKECKFHRDYAKAWAAKHAPEPKAKKVTEMKPKAKVVAPLKEKMLKAAGPADPQEKKRSRKAKVDLGAVTATMKQHKVTFAKATEMVQAGQQ